MEQPLAVNPENSHAKVQNVGGDSSAREQLSHYYLAHSARLELCRRLGRIPEARASYEKAPLTPQESDHRFLARRLEELK